MRNSHSTLELLGGHYPDANRLTFLPKRGSHTEEPTAESLIDQILRRQAEAPRILAELD